MMSSVTQNSSIPEVQEAPIQFDELVERCLGKIEFAERILTKFNERFPESIDQLVQSSEQGDLETVASVAHRLKGAAANISAPGILAVVEQIETKGRSGQADDLACCFDQLMSEWTRLTDYTTSRNLAPSDS